MRAAVIDIGSNSTKLVIAENVEDNINILESLKNVTGLGKNTFYKGRISQEVFNQVITILEKYKQVIKQYEVAEVKVIATTAVREAENKDIFLDTIQRKTGFTIDVLNVGDVVYYIDAFLSYKLKKTYPIHEKNVIIAELGAGSLDVSIMEKGFTLINLGIPIGTSRLKQFKSRIEGSQKEVQEALEEYVENEIIMLKKSCPKIKIDDVILIDESYSNWLHKVVPSTKRGTNFFPFTFREAKQFRNRINQTQADDLADKYDIPVDVLESIDGYGLILNKLFHLIKQRSIYILETSLAEAILANIIFGVELAKKYNKSNQLISVAKYLCQKYDADSKHSKYVAFLAEELFKHLKDSMGLNESHLLYLVLAAHLHNIGAFVSNRAHHKHTEYIISALNLFRLTENEIKVIACIGRYHRKAAPQKTHLLYGSLPQDQQILVQKISAILRLANALDSSHKQKVKSLEVAFDKDQVINLTLFVQDSFALEKVNFQDVRPLFEEVSGMKVNLILKRQK